jgi:hypothetical protein
MCMLWYVMCCFNALFFRNTTFVSIGVYSRLCIGISVCLLSVFLPCMESVMSARMVVWDWC